MYIKGSIRKYVDDLAARKPAPGGGSAAALEAALGCSLISMVANYTISNKRYIEVKERAKDSLKRSEKLRKRLLILVDGDVKAYKRLSNGLKKFDKGSQKLEQLYKETCDVPYEVCQLAYDGLNLCKKLIEYGNKNLITDSAMAALMLESAFFGAKFNVYINLRYINDKDYIEKMSKTLTELEEIVPSLKKEIIHYSEEVVIKEVG